MDGLWIDPLLMALKCTPAERFLLARLCFRAAGNAVVCDDSNKELGDAIGGIHPQSISDMVKAMEKRGLLTSSVDQKKPKPRQISPRADLVKPYYEKFATYKEKTDSKRGTTSKEIPDSSKEIPESSQGGSKGIPEGSVKDFLTGSKEIPDSIYKDIENSLENSSSENFQQQRPDLAALDTGDDGDTSELDALLAELERKAKPATTASGQNPPPVAAAPLPVVATPETATTVREKLTQWGLAQRYAMEILKVARGMDDYLALIEKYIIQREMEAEQTGKAAFPSMPTATIRFKNWLSFQDKVDGNSTKQTRSFGRSERSLAIITTDDLQPGGGRAPGVIDVGTADSESATVGNLWEITVEDLR